MLELDLAGVAAVVDVVVVIVVFAGVHSGGALVQVTFNIWSAFFFKSSIVIRGN
ncbi:hypothetical protein SAMD00019534_075770 [Acytostelium subglobosum LB1]|uniref:hypothetical protein n=1 Tax=Acytostelium subglobosum LB1 TaxID=1410327 RepID=UPI000644D164|nr:hypothetical protein SAMD00019534_075770 [Acytostelium subglobosum LB1]GAM24402.1 hypothetical protein SAMD00019534_075770 [Acytostelium subglobosum LB1]|eukprot:XP_012752728.1 hypothetical protein SAMD00019534_075770 [Acytostelium subglobosum LB1]